MLSSLLSLFRAKKPAPVAAAAQITQIPQGSRRMSLDERKAFRREMLYQSIRETFLSMEVIGGMYKFKVMPVDERHHRFLAMIDVGKNFSTDGDNRTRSFSAIEKMLCANAFKRFGISVDGVYWRVNETEDAFPQATRAQDRGNHQAAAARRPVASAAPLSAAPLAKPQAQAPLPLARSSFQPISEDETVAFMDALRKGMKPPVVRVGDEEYQSDLAPLDDGIMIGGTQYGKLS
ncbi:MAG: hypothetical protein IPH35_16085 [Rhodoferax sp.]|nr:hypothetical protein [Rhodoferax sp.]